MENSHLKTPEPTQNLQSAIPASPEPGLYAKPPAFQLKNGEKRHARRLKKIERKKELDAANNGLADQQGEQKREQEQLDIDMENKNEDTDYEQKKTKKDDNADRNIKKHRNGIGFKKIFDKTVDGAPAIIDAIKGNSDDE